MKNTPFYAGILTLATIVAAIGNELRIEAPDTLLQSITLSALPFSVGILVGLGSRLYFSRFVASGKFRQIFLRILAGGFDVLSVCRNVVAGSESRSAGSPICSDRFSVSACDFGTAKISHAC
jgi:hypothetical protein